MTKTAFKGEKTLEKGSEKSQGFFSKLWHKIKSYFSSLIPLVLMQLKDKIDMSHLKNKKKTFFKSIWSIVRFALVTVLIYLMFSLIISFGIFSFLQTLNFRAYLVIMTLIIILSFFACLVKTTSTLYFSKDNPVLITMPVKNSTLFTSKLIVCYIYELLKNLNYIGPFLIAYGIVMNLSFVYYLWIVAVLLIYTLLMVSICGLLSIPTMAIYILFKKNRILELIVLGVVIVAAIFAVVSIISLIPADIDIIRDWGKIYWAIQDFLKLFANIAVPFLYLLQFMTGMIYGGYSFNLVTHENTMTVLVITGIIVVCLALIYLLSKPLFLKMISSPFEYRKNENIKKKKNKKRGAFTSSAVQQSKRIIRSSNLIYSILAVAIITPIAVFLQNKIIAAMDTKILGNYMGVTFNILIILLLTLSSNTTIASIYSREGNSAYLNKVNPVSYAVPLSGKLVLNAFINCVSIIVSTIIITLFADIGVGGTIMLALSLVLIYLAHLFWSAEMDIMNPQNQQYQTTGDSQKNPNETMSTIYAFLVSALFAFICFFLMQDDIRVVFVKLLFISTLFFVIRTWLYFTKVKLYYKEK